MHYNVLPDEIKKDLRKEYRRRFLIVALFLFSAVGFMLAIGFLPALIVLQSKESHAQSELQALQTLKQNSVSADALATLKSTKEKLDVLSAPASSVAPSDLVKKIVSIKSPSISLSSIMYQPQKTGVTVVLTGTAATRDALLQFQSDIEHTTPFQKADIPVEQLAKSTDVGFSITVTGSF